MLSPERQNARMSKITNDGLRMLYNCTHMATVGVQELVYASYEKNMLYFGSSSIAFAAETPNHLHEG